MLRYDRSFPYKEEDVSWIMQRGERELMLATVSHEHPYIEYARWASFGWAVTEVYNAERID